MYGLQEKSKNMVMRFQSPLVYVTSYNVFRVIECLQIMSTHCFLKKQICCLNPENRRKFQPGFRGKHV